jgi:glycine betaine catabolism B
MTFRFSTEGSGFRYRSNQAIRLVLPAVEDPWGPSRAFSLSSSPSEPDVAAVTVKMTGSPYKQALRSLRVGEPVVALGPIGDLLYDPLRDSLFIAGGIGVTPFRGMIRFAADVRQHRAIRMLYSARVPEEFAFKAELDELAGKDPKIDVRYTVTKPKSTTTPWRGRTGRIDETWIREALKSMERPKVFVVGLPRMAADILDLLRSRMGFSEEDLEYEYFRGYGDVATGPTQVGPSG